MVLHILLIILKIIGIIIAVLLGLILLLLVILLCVPVRYRMEASMPGEIKESTVRGRVTWLLRLIRIDASFEEQELKWRVRIAWKSFGSEPTTSARPPVFINGTHSDEANKMFFILRSSTFTCPLSAITYKILYRIFIIMQRISHCILLLISHACIPIVSYLRSEQ